MRKIYVKASPFVAILQKRYDEVGDREIVAAEAGMSARSLYRIMGNGDKPAQKSISFDIADRIVTRILGPMAWYSDLELSMIYQTVDLAAVDAAFPVTVMA